MSYAHAYIQYHHLNGKFMDILKTTAKETTNLESNQQLNDLIQQSQQILVEQQPEMPPQAAAPEMSMMPADDDVIVERHYDENGQEILSDHLAYIKLIVINGFAIPNLFYMLL